jgi:hypothetical protein
MPASNQPNESGGAAELMYRMARQVGGARLIPLTIQRYYALDFSPSLVDSHEVVEDVQGSLSNSVR